MDIKVIAKICHEANRVYCMSIGDNSQKEWDMSDEWQKESAIKGVKFHLANPESLPFHSHEEWLKEKELTGWKYGPIKDTEKKEHPCFVPYNDLPEEQKIKDYLFSSIVKGLSSFIK